MYANMLTSIKGYNKRNMGGRGGGGGGHKLVEGSKLGGGAIVPGSGTETEVELGLQRLELEVVLGIETRETRDSGAGTRTRL